MSYATTADIVSEFKNLRLDTASSVKTAEVAEFIEQEEVIINAMISNRYEVPVSGTESVKILKRISIAYVAYRVAKILNLKKDIPIPEKLVPQTLNEGAARMKAEKRLFEIRDGKMVLSDAMARSSGQGVKSYNSENSICPLWERDTKQW